MSLWFLLVIVALLAGLLCRWILGKVSDLPTVGRQARSIGLIVLVVGIVITIISGNGLDSFDRFKKWRLVDGEVISAEVTGDRSFRPLVVYRYEVDGKQFTGESDLDVPGFGNKRKMYEVAATNIRAYQPGTRIPVFVDPADAAQSLLRATPTWDLFGRVGLGVLMTVIGGFVVSLPRRALGLSRAAVSERNRASG